MSTNIQKKQQIVSSEPKWFRYGRSALGGLILSLLLIGAGLYYTSGEGASSRDLLVNQLFISAIMVIGLQIFIGNTGIMSFGHMAFATIAGYIVAILLMPAARKMQQIPDAPFGLVDINYPPLAATLIAVALVVLFGLLLSFALTRSGQGAFAATIITLALLEIIHEATLNWIDLTDGGTGLGFIPRLENRTPIFLVLTGSIIVARVFSEMNVGRWAKAAREDDVAANLLGLDAKLPRIAALLLSVAIVALGASLKVQDVGSMTPRLLFFDFTLLTLAMLIVGGRRSVTGAILGVIIIMVGNEISRITGSDWRDVAGVGWLFRPTLPQLFLGIVMLGTMLLKPDGIIKDWEIDHIFRNLWRRKERRPADHPIDSQQTKRNIHTLKINDLVVEFGKFRALNGVSIEARSDEIVGLIGPNGAGKTTLLNAITGYVQTTEGSVMLDGEVLTGRQPHQIAKSGIARTFQNLRLFQDLSVRENIAVSAITTDRLEDVDPNENTNQLLVSANLWEQRYARASDLDYGNQRRLELARAAARFPNFLLLDEPTSGMNDDESALMVEHIRETAVSVQAGVIVIDHDLHFITQICDRVYVLDYGTLLASGTPTEIRENEAVRIAYLGK
ncbi:MAG: branched-chain amino acid ABC transporter ATP-binding protein/permease [Chloroflexi bacterium]|nr:branched-chain amino acid ABC transporter ATP-binding protein/permease [Chloroflexota bacterium]